MAGLHSDSHQCCVRTVPMYTVLLPCRMSALRNGSLLISPVIVNDSMIFTCRASNTFGGSSISTPITVHCKLTCL